MLDPRLQYDHEFRSKRLQDEAENHRQSRNAPRPEKRRSPVKVALGRQLVSLGQRLQDEYDDMTTEPRFQPETR